MRGSTGMTMYPWSRSPRIRMESGSVWERRAMCAQRTASTRSSAALSRALVVARATSSRRAIHCAQAAAPK